MALEHNGFNMGTISINGSDHSSVELSTPHCVLSDDVTSPFTFSETGYDAGREEELTEVEMSCDRPQDDNNSGLGLDVQPSELNKNSFPDLKTCDIVGSSASLTNTDLDVERKFISGLKSASGLSTEMEICI
jgi:hypothetical protein